MLHMQLLPLDAPYGTEVWVDTGLKSGNKQRFRRGTVAEISRERRKAQPASGFLSSERVIKICYQDEDSTTDSWETQEFRWSGICKKFVNRRRHIAMARVTIVLVTPTPGLADASASACAHGAHQHLPCSSLTSPLRTTPHISTPLISMSSATRRFSCH